MILIGCDKNMYARDRSVVADNALNVAQEKTWLGRNVISSYHVDISSLYRKYTRVPALSCNISGLGRRINYGDNDFPERRE